MTLSLPETIDYDNEGTPPVLREEDPNIEVKLDEIFAAPPAEVLVDTDDLLSSSLNHVRHTQGTPDSGISLVPCPLSGLISCTSRGWSTPTIGATLCFCGRPPATLRPGIG